MIYFAAFVFRRERDSHIVIPCDRQPEYVSVLVAWSGEAYITVAENNSDVDGNINCRVQA